MNGSHKLFTHYSTINLQPHVKDCFETLQEHSYHHGKDTTQKITALEKQVEELRKVAKNAKIREQRAKLSSKAMVKKLAECNLLTAELEAQLTSYKG